MLVKKLFIYVPFITSLIQVGQCHRTAQRNRDNRWPVVYTNDQTNTISYDPAQPVDVYIDLIKDGIFMAPNETSLLPSSDVVYTYDETSPVAKELMFVSALCKTTNCRESLDVWDCPTCSEVLPDAVVVRTFKTFPNDITGQILRSDNMTTFFIQVRGANSNSNRILWSKQNLVDHPFIPDARVQEGYLESALDIREIIRNTMKDQLTIYPNYKVAVVGQREQIITISIRHSFGAGVCSLVATHLQYDFPQLNRNNFKAYLLAKPRVGDYNYAKYVADKDIEIVRLVNALDGKYIICI
ncbi:hypothetical protein RMATCC62417_17183 [Rhizopus microsporus]|nr:hypothetical protein RMATCC62417_17183 [Rhizopus microsporus]